MKAKVFALVFMVLQVFLLGSCGKSDKQKSNELMEDTVNQNINYDIISDEEQVLEQGDNSNILQMLKLNRTEMQEMQIYLSERYIPYLYEYRDENRNDLLSSMVPDSFLGYDCYYALFIDEKECISEASIFVTVSNAEEYKNAMKDIIEYLNTEKAKGLEVISGETSTGRRMLFPMELILVDNTERIVAITVESLPVGAANVESFEEKGISMDDYYSQVIVLAVELGYLERYQKMLESDSPFSLPITYNPEDYNYYGGAMEDDSIIVH